MKSRENKTRDEIKETVLKNCMFNCDYYNVNIQISGEEACYSMKFRYLKDLLEYIQLKEKKILYLH